MTRIVSPEAPSWRTKRPPGGTRRCYPRAVSAPGPRRTKTLDRVLSKGGVASRTEARRWIAAGRVRVNGALETDPDRWLDPERDRVSVDGRPVGTPARVVLRLHKPKGFLTTAKDPQGRPTVYDLLPEGLPRVFPVGRLDLDTSGLLLMTNDAELAERLTNPDFKVPKTYFVTASGRLDDARLDALGRGVVLDDGPTRPAAVRRLREAGGRTVFEITISEGRNRQVRRMLEAVGAKVLELVRTSIGPLRIEEQPIGTCRALTEDELRAVRAAAGLPPRVSPRPRARPARRRAGGARSRRRKR